MSTNMRTPFSSRMKSPSRDCSSILRLYWKPEQPPGTTRTRSPEVSGKSSSPAINFLISVAADSVTLSVTVGAVVADMIFPRSFYNYQSNDSSGPILLPFSQNDKLRFHRLDRDLACHFLRYFAKSLRLRRLRITDDHGHPFVAGLAHFDAERDRAEKGHGIPCGERLAAAFAKDVIAHAG